MNEAEGDKQGRILQYLVPKHSELSLYVLSLAFLVTYLINPIFSEFLFATTLVDAAGWTFIQFYLATLFLVSLLAVLIDHDLVWYRTIVAPILILVTTSLLILAYIDTLLSQTDMSFLSLMLILYHMLTLYVLLGMFRGEDFSHKSLMNVRQAKKSEVVIATIFIPLVLAAAYLLFSPIQNWAVPISMVMFFWAMIDERLSRN